MSEQATPEQQKPSPSDDPLTDFALYARSKMGPFGRYPYASAFVAMALLMTLTRNCMRRILKSLSSSSVGGSGDGATAR